MNDVTEVGAKAKGKKDGKKAEGASAPTVEGQISRMLVRAIWAQEWSTANPDAKGEERKAAWKDARTAALEKNLRTYRRALGSLTRSGVAMTMTLDPAKTPGEDDDAED